MMNFAASIAGKPSAIPHLARSINANRSLRNAHSKRIAKCTPQPSLRVTSSVSQHRDASDLASKLPSASSSAYAKRSRIDYEDEAEPPNPRRVRGMVWATSIFGSCLGLYLSYAYMSYSRAISKSTSLNLAQNADVSSRWNNLTRNYDDEVDLSEKMMFMRQKRSRLVNDAYGHVLEVSVGTGRNMDLYDLRPYDPKENASTGRSRKRIIRSLTFNDQSEFMVAQAEKKFEGMETARKPEERFTGLVEFVVGDAGIKGVVDRPNGGYDTIVQTMGVCSMVDAVGFLRRLGELCRQPGEKSEWGEDRRDDGQGGQILLLEHGRGNYQWLNRFLDNGAKMHADHYGCWWNKDIARVLKESGLVVERMRRYHMGTTWEIVLRPARKMTPEK